MNVQTRIRSRNKMLSYTQRERANDISADDAARDAARENRLQRGPAVYAVRMRPRGDRVHFEKLIYSIQILTGHQTFIRC